MESMKIWMVTLLLSLFAYLLIPSGFVHATAMYDGDLTGSIVIHGCSQGSFSVSCASTGLVLYSFTASPAIDETLALGNATANGSIVVTAINGNGLEGEGFSVTSVMDGSASSPPFSGALSQFLGEGTFTLVNTSQTSVTVTFAIIYDFSNSIAIDDVSQEVGLSVGSVSLLLNALEEDPIIIAEEVFQEQCFNNVNIGFPLGSSIPDNPDPCSETSSGPILVSYTLPGCASDPQFCDSLFAFRAGFSLVGIAEVVPVPEPNGLVLLMTGLSCFGAMSWRRCKRH